MGAVTVTIPRLADEGGTPPGAAAELPVCSENASVNDVDIDTGTSSVVVRVTKRPARGVLAAQSTSLGDALQAPGSVSPI